MAIVTTAEAKTILGITGTTYDTQLDFFLPLVEKDIVSYIGHAFQDGYVYRESASNFTFVRGDSDTYDYITDEENEFKEKGFRDGMDVAIEGGWSNVGIYTVSSASTGKLTLDEYGVLIDQDQDDTKDDHYIGLVRISRVVWPDELKLTAAKMAWYQIDNAKVSDVQSESLDDYSITYAGANAYPVRLITALDKFRKPRFA
jgi:hypothetical protein